ncbi:MULTISPECIES: DUF4265 domain-containing protein [unclassified Streptomyces]|uniref:DUF4265 domain-containing protein n=1 Tax=unclassified Streptomyces TaxID=2593676 RepID=UPI0033A4AA1E
MESLWAVDRGDGTAEPANTPFFVRGVANGDTVETDTDDDGTHWAGKGRSRVRQLHRPPDRVPRRLPRRPADRARRLREARRDR